MKHYIELPQNWVLQNDFHTYLWKLFPMDEFAFISTPALSGPRYAGTTMTSDETEVTASFDHEVDEAVRGFHALRNAA